MKTFTALFVAASAALTSAQVTYNQTTNQFVCATPDAVYCAGDSLSTNIIIRCVGTRGYPGNCNDNLAGYPPVGVQPAQCWQSSLTSGDAACSKNCVVYGSSGNYNGTFTLPGCTPYYTASSSTVAPTSTLTTTYSQPSLTVNTITTTVGTVTTTTDCPTESLTTTTTLSTTTDCFTTSFVPSGKPTTYPTGGPSYGINGTTTVSPTGSSTAGGSPTGSPTATPVGPTKTPSATPTQYTGAASVKQAAAGMAAAGLLFAAFL